MNKLYSGLSAMMTLIKMNKFYQRQKGATIILLIVLILSVFLIISFGISDILFREIKMSSESGQSMMAFYAADAGAEKCLYEARKSTGNCSSVGGINSAALDNGASFSVTRTANTMIDSLGQFSQTSRKIEVTWENP